VKGVSGGERKRTAIGVELITDPQLIFLDEPTTGLDSFTAASVMETLRALAASGRTVISTIHQPNTEIFDNFDRLMLVA
jgi:ABC-type multidrug transport system ATPase subunit